MSKGDYLEYMLLDTVFVNGTFTKPATLYLALYTSDPTDADTGTELSGTGYARTAVSNNGTSFSRTGNSVSNAQAITTSKRTGTAATVTHFGWRTAASGGNLLYHGALQNPVAISANVPTDLTFDAGTLTVTEN